MGQEFPLNSTYPRFTINATNANNHTTQNYDGDFWKLSGNLANRTYSNNSTIYANATSGTNASLVHSTTGTTSLYGVNTDYNGTEWITLNDEWLTYEKPANSTEPFPAQVKLALNATDLTDPDGVCYDPDNDNDCDPYIISSINGTQLLYGKVNIFPAYGSELIDLDMQFETQYYNATTSQFARNIQDNCTEYHAANMTCSDPDVSDQLLCADVNSSTSENVVVQGQGSFTLSAPGKNKTGTLDWSLTLAPWLGNSTAPATFGIYKGNEHIIYQQETTWK
jgi:MSHA biogenesis protein MshQ